MESSGGETPERVDNCGKPAGQEVGDGIGPGSDTFVGGAGPPYERSTQTLFVWV